MSWGIERDRERQRDRDTQRQRDSDRERQNLMFPIDAFPPLHPGLLVECTQLPQLQKGGLYVKQAAEDGLLNQRELEALRKVGFWLAECPLVVVCARPSPRAPRTCVQIYSERAVAIVNMEEEQARAGRKAEVSASPQQHQPLDLSLGASPIQRGDTKMEVSRPSSAGPSPLRQEARPSPPPDAKKVEESPKAKPQPEPQPEPPVEPESEPEPEPEPPAEGAMKESLQEFQALEKAIERAEEEEEEEEEEEAESSTQQQQQQQQQQPVQQQDAATVVEEAEEAEEARAPGAADEEEDEGDASSAQAAKKAGSEDDETK